METPEFNVNEVIASFMNERIDSFFTSGKSLLKATSDSVSIKFKTKYNDYLKNLVDRYGKTRSFFIRDEAKDLYSFYIPVGLRASNKTINTASVKEIVSVNKFAVIAGSGGSGKSILLRHFLYDSLASKYKVPVFIELRDLNFERLPIVDFIKKTLKVFGLDVDADYLKKSLEAGHYILLLDGFDEVKTELRNDLIHEIESFSKQYPECTIITTTRPDDRVSGLTLFTTFYILPLTLEKSVSLIEKLPAIEEIKNKFIKDLKEGLFVKHESFLSNPLLLSIMLLTYEYSADIPSRLSIFYNQAYEALFQRHDALKGAYNRDKRVALDILEFEKVLSAFCIQTYDDRRFQFSKNEIIHYLDKCKALTGIEFNTTNFLEDLLQSVCILAHDGLFIVFTHRSFQEYFTARFIARSNNDVKKKLIGKYRVNIITDIVIKLTYELDKDFFDAAIILPFIREIQKKYQIKAKISMKSYLAFVKGTWERFRFEHGTFYGTMNEGRNGSMVGFIIFETKIINPDELYANAELCPYIKQNEEKSKTGKAIIFETKDLAVTDEFVIEISQGAKFFSIKTLQGLLEVKKKIEESQKSKKDNLETILLSKPKKTPRQ